MSAFHQGVWTSELGRFLLRGALGVVFVGHGAQKLFGVFGGPGLTGFSGFLDGLGIPFPMVNAVLAGSAEFFGGLALLAGVGTRAAAALLVVTMTVAAFAVRSRGLSVQNGGMEYPLVLAVLLFGIGLIGPGRLTVGSLIRSAPAREHDLVKSH
ncbi:DoxX family protein [Singulisphaera acidiphila]|uniref:Putative membrane protein n=1 Tax=Singulisphaera acidiphila (strain ATCC BAA-1392 / DSM 18658 / VKM B-2454 / MOB10) TaxID=886293 RepID=L0DPU1_SINAD|nr:DoxX family protein [Singulisphaera acidiphila]AGA30858.1 putative membrane protein [Singulisphaera acidiphila DSM 18658]